MMKDASETRWSTTSIMGSVIIVAKITISRELVIRSPLFQPIAIITTIATMTTASRRFFMNWFTEKMTFSGWNATVPSV